MDKKHKNNSDDDKCFQYVITVALNHEEIGKKLQRISTIKPFINKCNWKGVIYSSEKHDWKKFVKNDPTIVFNELYVKRRTYILPAFQSQLKSSKPNHSFNDCKWRRMAFSCSKKILCIIERDNVKTYR